MLTTTRYQTFAFCSLLMLLAVTSFAIAGGGVLDTATQKHSVQDEGFFDLSEIYFKHDPAWELRKQSSHEVLPDQLVTVVYHASTSFPQTHRIRMYASEGTLRVLAHEINLQGRLDIDTCFVDAWNETTMSAERLLSVSIHDKLTQSNDLRVFSFTDDYAVHPVICHFTDLPVRGREVVSGLDEVNYCDGSFPFYTRIWATDMTGRLVATGSEFTGQFKLIGERRYDKERQVEVPEFQLVIKQTDRYDITVQSASLLN